MHLIANFSKLSFHINLNSNIKHHNHQNAINLSLLTKFPLLFSYWYLMSSSPLSRTHVFPFSFFNTKSAISSVKSSFGVRFSGCRVEFVLSIEHFLTEKEKCLSSLEKDELSHKVRKIFWLILTLFFKYSFFYFTYMNCKKLNFPKIQNKTKQNLTAKKFFF